VKQFITFYSFGQNIKNSVKVWSTWLNNIKQKTKTKGKTAYSEWVGDCCLTPIQQFLGIMARTS
jgi:hypothetical protein